MLSFLFAIIVTSFIYVAVKRYKRNESKPTMSKIPFNSIHQQYKDVEFLSDDDDDSTSISVESEINVSSKEARSSTNIIPKYGKRKGAFNWDEFKSGQSLKFKKKANALHDTKSEKPLAVVEITDDEEDESFSTKKKIAPSIKINTPEINLEEPQVTIHNRLVISKVTVDFPVKPYPCQTAVMNMLIKGCTNKQNCLLESPTGSGKTLALLCSSLAWQDNFAQEVAKEDEKQFAEHVKNLNKIEITNDEPGCSKNNEEKCCEMEANDDDYFKEAFDNIEKRPKIPKIYYGSRTHKQIEQVVKELKKTIYRDKSMTILSSREHSCIQSPIKKSKTQLCNELLDPLKKIGCPYYNDRNKNDLGSNMRLQNYGIHGPWDLEELVNLGKDIGCCPYFAARQLMIGAEIIFCPYNYLIDPQIRETMQLDLKDQIIILDEAHNIEDICRDVASKTIREDHIEEIMKEVTNLAQIVEKRDEIMSRTYDTIYNYCQSFVKFIKYQLVKSINGSDEHCSDYWKGDELVGLFDIHQLGDPKRTDFYDACKKVIVEYNNAKENVRDMWKEQKKKQMPPVIITQNTKRVLEDFIFIIEKITSPSAKDFRSCIMENDVRDFKTLVDDDKWITERPVKKRIKMLKLLCMYPGVIFKPLSELARSIILASGTLAPTNSFQSELGTTFPNMLQANHVIPKDQVYVRGIAHGPTGIGLKANYTNTNLFNFKDELGRLLVQVCQSVPHGILCFFSSYKMMNSQIERWRETGVWDQLENYKHILMEPRFGNELDEVMTEFRTVIRDTSKSKQLGVTGALLFAVFRGKVAEGIDFSDDEARCVLTVGIPFAVRKDPAVDMKMMYNDLNKSKGLLSGSDWYSIQAFRALNQALGRCIRHKNDWGAVLVVDERFVSANTAGNLPKWVKTMWRSPARVNLHDELREFVKIQKIQEEERLNF